MRGGGQEGGWAGLGCLNRKGGVSEMEGGAGRWGEPGGGGSKGEESQSLPHYKKCSTCQ